MSKLKHLAGLLLTAALISLIVVALASCESMDRNNELRSEVAKASISAANDPLLSLTCPQQGCIIGSLKIGNPSSGQQFTNAIQMLSQPTGAERIWTSIIDKGFGSLGTGLIVGGIRGFASSMFASQTATSLGGFNAIANTANSGFTATSNIAGQIQAPAANITTTTSNSIGGSGVIGSGSYTGPVTNTSTATSTVTTVNPSPRVCTPTYGPTGTPTGFSCVGG